MNLQIAVSPSQIDAAERLRHHFRQWNLSDAALKLLHEKCPGFEPETCLLKAVAINSIYGTNVLAIVRFANDVKQVIGRHGVFHAGPELVEAIARASGDTGQPIRKRTSFAAKFCHFFIEPDRFPIYDDAVCQALKLHFGKGFPAHDYKSFCSHIEKLRSSVGNGCTTRMLDHYLWLTGMYMRWRKERERPKPRVNEELQTLFNQPTKAQRAELDALLPDVIK